MAIHTSDIRKFDKLWEALGGTIQQISGTGEYHYRHVLFYKPIRMNGRRKDVPAKLLSALNQIMRMPAANDPEFSSLKTRVE